MCFRKKLQRLLETRSPPLEPLHVVVPTPGAGNTALRVVLSVVVHRGAIGHSRLKEMAKKPVLTARAEDTKRGAAAAEDTGGIILDTIGLDAIRRRMRTEQRSRTGSKPEQNSLHLVDAEEVEEEAAEVVGVSARAPQEVKRRRSKEMLFRMDSSRKRLCNIFLIEMYTTYM